jgi:hypothetical protein
MPRKKWSEIRAKAAPETLESAARDTRKMAAAIVRDGRLDRTVDVSDGPDGISPAS